jgi:hypothetical protein
MDGPQVYRLLSLAGRAINCPEVQQNRPAQEAMKTDLFPTQIRQREVGSTIAYRRPDG